MAGSAATGDLPPRAPVNGSASPRRPAAPISPRPSSPPRAAAARSNEPVAPAPAVVPDPPETDRAGASDVAPPAAAPAAPIAPIAPIAIDAGAAPGYVVVHNDLWCTISVDGVPRGNRRNEPLEVAAGRHTVRCVNPAGSWTQTAEVAPGATQVLSGSVARALRVTLAIDATISGTAYARGAVVTLKPGVVEVVAGDKKQFLSLRESCTLRDAPELACFP
jgi:hypothetical protein